MHILALKSLCLQCAFIVPIFDTVIVPTLHINCAYNSVINLVPTMYIRCAYNDIKMSVATSLREAYFSPTKIQKSLYTLHK